MEKLNKKHITQYLTKCEGCGKPHLPLSALRDGKSYCVACTAQIEVCGETGKTYLRKEMTKFVLQGVYIKTPKKGLTMKSSVSGKKIYIGTVWSGNPDHPVGKRARKVYIKADEVEKYALEEELKRNRYIELSDGFWIKRHKTIKYAGEFYIKSTVGKKLYDEGKLISDYSHKPKPLFKSTVEKANTKRGIPYLGAELEMSCGGIHLSESAVNMFDKMIDKGMEEIFYMKPDSSIDGNGIEFVSHPVTLSYFKNLPIKQFFDDLKDEGFRAHKTCGLHVHVSRNALTKKEWWSVMAFISKCAPKIKKFSRRDGVSQYCEFWNNQHGLMAALSKGADIFRLDVPANGSRSAIINFRNADTVEFRFFQSTDSHTEFLASLSFVDALVRFVQKYSFMYIQDERSSNLWGEFTEFCKKEGYGSLIKCLEKMSLINKKQKVLCV